MTRRKLTQTIEDLARLQRDLEPLLDRFDDMSADGFGSGGSGGPVGAGGPSSPVEARAFTVDPAALARARFDAMLAGVSEQADALETVRRMWLGQAPRQRAGEPRSNGCVLMAEIGVYEPGTPTDCAGNLPEPMVLCRWAKNFVIRYGGFPSKAERERHAQGGRIRRRHAA